jgi:hypothetical protein
MISAAGTFGVFGGSVGASGTITSSKLSCPTAFNVNATGPQSVSKPHLPGVKVHSQTPIAKLMITTPVARFLKMYGRLARMRAADCR